MKVIILASTVIHVKDQKYTFREGKPFFSFLPPISIGSSSPLGEKYPI